jgi:hypothetical protein
MPYSWPKQKRDNNFETALMLLLLVTKKSVIHARNIPDRCEKSMVAFDSTTTFFSIQLSHEIYSILSPTTVDEKQEQVHKNPFRSSSTHFNTLYPVIILWAGQQISRASVRAISHHVISTLKVSMPTVSNGYHTRFISHSAGGKLRIAALKGGL